MESHENDRFRFLSLSKKENLPIFHCPKLDKFVTPCIKKGHIIEITGKAGAGKTQMILSICAGITMNKMSECPKNEPGTLKISDVTIVISTEGQFPVTRLNEMVTDMNENRNVMDKIFIEEATDALILFDCLENKIPQMCAHNKVGLIVIDSIAGPLRSEYTGDNWKEKTATIHKIGTLITNLARNYNVPVVIVNQVTAYIDQPYESFGRSVVPCFGIALSNYVHTRIFVSRTDKMIKETVSSEHYDGSKANITAKTRIRTLTIDFSPLLPSGIPIHFVVSKRGITGVEIVE